MPMYHVNTYSAVFLCFSYLRYSLSLGDILISDLHSWVAKSLQQISRIQTQ